MKEFLVYLPTVISFIIGISSDVKFKVKDPVLLLVDREFWRIFNWVANSDNKIGSFNVDYMKEK